MQRESKATWPVGAMVAVGSLVLSVALIFVVFQQQSVVTILVKEQEKTRDLQLALQQGALAVMQEVERSRRYELGFGVRQTHYGSFMSVLLDGYASVVQENDRAFASNLLQLEKEFYALEPFLAEGTRHLLWKQMKAYGRLGLQLTGKLDTKSGLNLLQDKHTLNNMVDSFRELLYPALFETIQQNGAKAGTDEARDNNISAQDTDKPNREHSTTPATPSYQPIPDVLEN